MSKIRAVSGILFTLLVMPLMILLMYVFRNHHRKIRKFCAQWFLKIFGVKAEVTGEPDLQAQILLMNHQSFMDVIYMEAVHKRDLCWIAKKDLGKPFLYGHALKAPKMILINRENKKELVFLMKKAKKRLSEGRLLCIFPEGTRSKGLEKFLPFKKGAKFLIEHFKLKVQPIVFCRTRQCLDIGAIDFKNVTFQVKYLESFIPKEKDWFEKLREKMQEEYNLLYHQTQES